MHYYYSLIWSKSYNIAESGKVTSAFIVEGTQEKEYRAIDKKFETVGMNIFHIQDDKIKEGCTYCSNTAWCGQVNIF
jgi:hypothetical protein